MANNQTLDQLLKDRAKKLELINAAEINPYPASTKKTFSNLEAKDSFKKLKNKSTSTLSNVKWLNTNSVADVCVALFQYT